MLFFLLGVLFCSNLLAAVYQKPAEFLDAAFSSEVPEPKILWIKKALRKQVRQILNHSPGFLRTRYWKKDQKTAWILEEIGKVKPITIGVTVNKGRIDKIKVLAFRETRGWEVKHTFFTDQFKQTTLTDELLLDRPIDGISGATLSVDALKKIARLALLFDKSAK